jgi:hypothetical protein
MNDERTEFARTRPSQPSYRMELVVVIVDDDDDEPTLPRTVPPTPPVHPR